MDRSWKSIVFQTVFAHPDNIRLKAQAPIVKNYLKGILMNRDTRAIDIGCGTGRYTWFLSQVAQSVICIDPNPSMLERVRQKYRNQKIVGAYCNTPLLVQGEVERLPFKSGVFEIALLVEVLEHIEDDRSGLNEVRRILKSNGELILSTPCPPPAYPDKLHKREGYTRDEIFKLLSAMEFKVISYKFCMFWWSRMMLKFAVNFISLFKFSPPVLFLIAIERVFKKPPPFDIIIKSRK